MKQTQKYFFETLAEVYPKNEIGSLFQIVCKHLMGYSANDLILNKEATIDEQRKNKIIEIAERLKLYEPIQYILGETEFYGLRYFVSPSVLIPRNETEELVDLIVKRNRMHNPKILDIGTGSGCIAISLKKMMPLSTVYAIDISEKALEIATRNATLNGADIQFVQHNIFSVDSFSENGFDIIVSNPPYVTLHEKEQMHPNVLEHEPHLALFVPNDDPLIFYRTIVENYRNSLALGGEFFFEINEAFGNEIVELLENNQFSARIVKDINGKNRIAYGTKKNETQS